MLKKILSLTLISTSFLMVSTPALANTQVSGFADNTYIGIDYFQGTIDITDSSTEPAMARFRIGTDIIKQIAVELQYSTSANTDSLNSLEAELEDVKAAYFRLKTPMYRGFHMDVALGYAETSLLLTGAEDGSINNDIHSGFSWGVAFYQTVKGFDNIEFKLGYQSLYRDDNVDIDGYVAGVSYRF